MDTGMRDLEQLEERPREGGAKATIVVLAAIVAVSLVFAMGVVIGDSPTEAQDAGDPLAALDDNAALVTAAASAAPAPMAEVDRQALSFPATLVDERPEVAAALAAAAAEHDHLDPLPRRALGFDVQLPAAHTTAPIEPPSAFAMPMAVEDPAATVARVLPAAVSASPEGAEIAAAAEHDPMVAAALPLPTDESPAADSGEDGEFTLQVISYRSSREADVFAEALKKRGHTAFVTEADIDGRGTFHRVRVGPFPSQRAANEYRRTFEREERMNTFVVRRRD